MVNLPFTTLFTFTYWSRILEKSLGFGEQFPIQPDSWSFNIKTII